jgi:hypothetical protein
VLIEALASGFQEDAMKLLTHLNRSAHQFQQSLHLPWQAPQDGGGDRDASTFVWAVTLVSIAAALVLVLAP